jgi:hypothetical protein
MGGYSLTILGDSMRYGLFAANIFSAASCLIRGLPVSGCELIDTTIQGLHFRAPQRNLETGTSRRQP